MINVWVRTMKANPHLEIAEASGGALRDAEVMLSRLQAVFGNGPITKYNVEEALGLIPSSMLHDFFALLAGGERAGAVAFVGRAYESGVDLENFARSFLQYVRKVLLAKISKTDIKLASTFDPDELKRLLEQGDSCDGQLLVRMIENFTDTLIEMKSSPIPQLPLELAVIALTVGE